MPINVCGVVFGSPYMYLRDVIFMRIENQYHIIKDGKYFIISVDKGKSKIFVVSDNQANKLISSCAHGPFSHDAYKEAYIEDEEFKDAFQ